MRVGTETADSGTVVVHRVGPAFAGEMDSVAVAPDGTFELRLPGVDEEGTEVFFASIRYDGVLYFGSAIHDPAGVDSVYAIQAYPALEVPAGTRLPVRVRNLFIEASDSGWTVTDLFELANTGTSTLVAPDGGASWSHRLPPGATDFRVGQSDLPPDDTRLVDGSLVTGAPIPPGESVYLVQYRVPEEGITIPNDSPTESVELLVREPAPDVSVSGLAHLDPVEVDGQTYRRFAATDLSPTVLEVVPGRRAEPRELIPWLGVALALLLALAGGLLALRNQGPRARGDVLVQVARLDEAQAAGRIDEAEYQRRRELLLRGLRP